jgi:uncharacterized membrane protein
MDGNNTVARTLHDLGGAAWFGGSLMGAVGLNGASAEVTDPSQRSRVANAGWARWTPVNLAAIAAHIVGGVGLMRGNKARLVAQKGAGGANVAKLVFTGIALGATAYSRALGQKVMNAGDVPAEGGTSPNPMTPEKVAKAQRQLDIMQWVIPAATGGIMALASLMGEQQRPRSVAGGVARRLFPAA